MLKHNPVKFICSLILSLGAGAIGSVATYPNIASWYTALEKPVFSPPNWVFAPVWTVLYLLMGISLYLVWVATYKKSKTPAFVAFGVQLVLNTLWSLIFFGAHWPWGGVVVIIAMLVAIFATIKLFWPISKTASYLLLPYVLWVSFATLLNTSVALLN